MPKRTRSNCNTENPLPARRPRRESLNSASSGDVSEALTSVSTTLERISSTMEKLVETNATMLANVVNPNAAEVRINMVPNGDAIPTFDPSVPGQAITKWLTKVDELRISNKWSSELTAHYALAKLKGLAADWYNGLPSVQHTWDEWKAILAQAFPRSENYPKLLREMLRRVKKSDESYEQYYYAKCKLLTACEIEGKKAVACLIDGLEDDSVANSASAAKLATPTALFEYLMSLRENKRDRSISISMNCESRGKVDKSKDKNKSVQCHKCGRRGHYAKYCRSSVSSFPSQSSDKPANEKKSIEFKQCSFCHRFGHLEANCFKKKNSSPGNKLTGANPPPKVA